MNDSTSRPDAPTAPPSAPPAPAAGKRSRNLKILAGGGCRLRRGLCQLLVLGRALLSEHG